MTGPFRFLVVVLTPFVAVVGLGLGAPARAGVVASSYFDSGTEGWMTSGDAEELTWVADVGNPAGSISVVDQQVGGDWYFLAPASFNAAAVWAYGGALSFDLMQDPNGGSLFDAPDVKLETAGLTLGYMFNRAPSTTEFTSYEVALDVSAAWMVLDSANVAIGAASEAQIRAALANLTGLHIRGEFSWAKDTGYLDNVVMTGFVPEPSSLTLAGLSLIPLGVGLVRHWRRAAGKAAA